MELNHEVSKGKEIAYFVKMYPSEASHEERNSNKLSDQYAKLTDGSCPSHHSPNDVIPLSNDNTCLWLGNLNHL